MAALNTLALDAASTVITGLRAKLASALTAIDKLMVAQQIQADRDNPPKPTWSDQFKSYEKAILKNEGSPGMLEQISLDPRLLDGEGEKLLQLAASKPYKPAKASTPKTMNPNTIQPSTEDKAYVQSIISGAVDLLDPGLYDKLEPLFAKYEADPEMMALLTKAADAYGKAVEAAAMGALGR